jgi:hypothetical protein
MITSIIKSIYFFASIYTYIIQIGLLVINPGASYTSPTDIL